MPQTGSANAVYNKYFRPIGHCNWHYNIMTLQKLSLTI
jgi:hypothetical protein